MFPRTSLLSVLPMSNDALYCYPLNNVSPQRRSHGAFGLFEYNKMVVWPEQWPADRYPDYCLGWIYALTPALAGRLSGVTEMVPLHTVDDLYVTGFLRTAAAARIEMLSTSWLLHSYIWKWISRYELLRSAQFL